MEPVSGQPLVGSWEGTLKLLQEMRAWLLVDAASIQIVFVAGGKVHHVHLQLEPSLWPDAFNVENSDGFCGNIHIDPESNTVSGKLRNSFSHYQLRSFSRTYTPMTIDGIRAAAVAQANAKRLDIAPYRVVFPHGALPGFPLRLPCHYTFALWDCARPQYLETNGATGGLIGKINEDCVQRILEFAVGPISGLTYPRTRNTWGGGDDGGGGPTLAFVESIGVEAQTIHVGLKCGDVNVTNVKVRLDRGQLHVSWNNNNDALRSTKPVSAQLTFAKGLDAFTGSCAFPGEGPIGYNGSR